MFTGPNTITDGLVLALDAGNTKSYPGTSTIWNDVSGNGNSGTLINGPTFDTGSNGSIVFDGVNDYVSMNNKNPPSINSTFSNGLSIGFTLKLNNPFPSTTDGRAILTRNSQGAGSNAYNLSIKSNRRLRFWINTTSNMPLSTTILNSGQIYIGMVVLDRTTGQTIFYLQGILDSSTTYSPTLSTASHNTFNVGYWGSSGWEFPGNIYNIYFYNRALTAQEVLQNYNATKSRFNL